MLATRFASRTPVQQPTLPKRSMRAASIPHCLRPHSSSSHPPQTTTDVIVLDFDGVIVDSEPEVSTSAYVSAQAQWPALFQGVGTAERQRVMEGMRMVRPALVKGYEAMVMVRMLLEDPGCAPSILQRWSSLLPLQLERYGETEQSLHSVFERTRNGWLADNPGSWHQLQRPYPGAVEAFRDSPFPIYIASSKASHRVSALLSQLLGADVPPDSPRLFCSLLPPEEKKAEALREVRSLHPGSRIHFVDDRLDTLAYMAEQKDLADCCLHLADWGYNTEEEREEARRLGLGVHVLPLLGFLELLQHGSQSKAAAAAVVGKL